MTNKNRVLNFQRQANIDNFAYQLLNPITKHLNYLPFTGSALRPSALATVLNDILINNRKNIIEFGCGISTLIIAKFIELNNLDAKLYSVEEEENWLKFTRGQLEHFGVADKVTSFFAPIEELESNVRWHNLSFLNEIDEIDCLIVDGPKAYEAKNKMIRRHALPYLKSKLKGNYAVFLDDCHREGEKAILKDWAADLNHKKSAIYYHHLGVMLVGDYYNVML